MRGGGRAGRGNGGTVRHCSCLGTPEQEGSLQGAIIGGAFVECSHFGWEPTPWGEGARVMGAGGSPRQCAINLKRGLPTAPISGGAKGGLSASYLSVCYFVVCRLIVSLYFSIFFYSICKIYRKAEISEPISTFFDISYISSVV